MRTKRMNRRLCFWNFASLTNSWQRLTDSNNTPAHKTGVFRHTLSRLAPNFPYRRGLLALALLLPSTALAGPAGEMVTGGTATITRPDAVTTLITQQSQKAVIDWQNFSIAQPEMVRFQQPGSDSIALNRVLGNDPSRIYGNLSANGQVFLVNPGGVLFASGSQVSVQGLLATTHDINNDDFMAGRYLFAHRENQLTGAEVINQGTLQAGNNGYIVLAGDYAANSGVIQARLGQVALASGNRFTLDLDGDQLIGLAVDEASLAKRAGVANFGSLAADGGRVLMTAQVAGELATAVVNNEGLVQARTIEEHNGAIILQGGAKGIVANSGTLDASGNNINETGGSVQMLGEKVGLKDHSLIDVSGHAGGGTALIGGDYQGKNSEVQNAQATYVGSDALIRADAAENGNGGRVIVWADDTTRFYGSISTQGGQSGGDGGFVEVSGKRFLDFRGMADTRSPLGNAGTLLLDPTNITIQSASPDINGDNTPGDDITAATDLDNAAGDFPGANSVITSGALGVLLNTTAVTLAATNDITVNNAVSWTSAFSLALDAGNNVAINANLTSTLPADPPGNISITAGNLISLNANLSLTANTTPSAGVTLTAGTGGITQTSGTITADSLKVVSAGSVNLPSLNQNTTIAANLSGVASPFTYESANGFSIGNVGGTLGVTTNNGAITIRGNGSGPMQIAESVSAGTGNILLDQANVGGGGDIDVANTKTVGGNNVQLYASDANGLLTINGTVSGTGSVLLNTPGTITIPNAGLVSGPSLNLTADSMDLQAGSSINAGAGLAWLKPYTATWGIDLGIGTAINSLGLTTNELNTITTTGVLRVGDMTAGNLGITAAIAPSNASIFSLESGGNITQASAGTISATNLAIKSLGNVTLDTAANLVTNLAASIGNGSNLNKNFNFKNTPALNIGSNIDSITGISLAMDTNNFAYTTPNNIIALTSSGALTQSTGALLGGKAVYAEGSRVTLTEANPTGIISGKSTGGSTGDDSFAYTSANPILLSQVAGVTGVTANPVGPDPLALKLVSTGGSINQEAGASLSASGRGAHLDAQGGAVVLDSTPSSLASLSARASSGGVFLSNSTALTITDLGSGVTGVNGGSGDVLITAPSIIVEANSSGNNFFGLIANQAPTGTIDIVGTATITATGVASIVADGIFTISGTGTVTADKIYLGPYTSGYPMRIGALLVTAFSIPDTTDLEETRMITPRLLLGEPITSSPTGYITIAGNISRPTTELLIGTGGLITQLAGTTISAQTLGILAEGDIDLSSSTNSIDKIAAQSMAGTILVNNGTSITTVSGTEGSTTISGLNTNNQNITLTSTSNITLDKPISAGTGQVWLTSNSGEIVDANGVGVNNVTAGTLNVQAYSNIELDAQVSSVTAISEIGTVMVRPYPPVVSPPPPPPPTIDQCTANPSLSGCSTVLPSLATCTATPSTPGCTAVLPTIATCTATPTAPGCTAVLPSLATCTATPSTPGCTAVLPTIATCTATPTAQGCTAVLPSLATCTTTPTAPGCSVVLPSLATCTATPSTPGCTAVLPSVATCTVTPTTQGCTAVLPSLATCTATPSTPGCTAVLPSIATCTATPSTPGCTTVLPSLATCTATPSTPGCTAVLPSIATCTATPTAQGCTAVLPTLATCTATPSTPGCSVVLPSTATCATNPTLPGCTAVLPPVLIKTPPTEVTATILAVIIPTQTIRTTVATPSSSNQQSNSGSGENERRAQGIVVDRTSQDLPLAKQPIFDLNGGGIAGQNMVCK